MRNATATSTTFSIAASTGVVESTNFPSPSSPPSPEPPTRELAALANRTRVVLSDCDLDRVFEPGHAGGCGERLDLLAGDVSVRSADGLPPTGDGTRTMHDADRVTVGVQVDRVVDPDDVTRLESRPRRAVSELAFLVRAPASNASGRVARARVRASGRELLDAFTCAARLAAWMLRSPSRLGRGGAVAPSDE